MRLCVHTIHMLLIMPGKYALSYVNKCSKNRRPICLIKHFYLFIIFFVVFQMWNAMLFSGRHIDLYHTQYLEAIFCPTHTHTQRKCVHDWLIEVINEMNRLDVDCVCTPADARSTTNKKVRPFMHARRKFNKTMCERY